PNLWTNLSHAFPHQHLHHLSTEALLPLRTWHYPLGYPRTPHLRLPPPRGARRVVADGRPTCPASSPSSSSWRPSPTSIVQATSCCTRCRDGARRVWPQWLRLPCSS